MTTAAVFKSGRSQAVRRPKECRFHGRQGGTYREAHPSEAGCRGTGIPIGAMDLLIAAHARALGAVEVTHSTADLSRVASPRCENWAEPAPGA